MAKSDQVIFAQDVLHAVMTVRRRTVDRMLEELERHEPDLAEIVFEETTAIHQRLLDVGASAKQARRIMRRTESLIVVTVLAVQQGYRRLWQEPEVEESTSPDVPVASEPPDEPEGGDLPAGPCQ